MGAAGDIRMLTRGGIAGRERITRHLWRMSFGLYIATGSFFLGQQQVSPLSCAADRPRCPALPLDDLLALPRPLQQGLQSTTSAHADACDSLKLPTLWALHPVFSSSHDDGWCGVQWAWELSCASPRRFTTPSSRW
jgi:hypothetical protein